MARKAAGEMDESGFTLIELLIVIVVLGILAGVVIFALGGVTGQSAIAACSADGATVSTALAAFSTDNPGVTATPTLLLPASGGGAATGESGGPFLQSWPSNGTHYSYSLETGTGALMITVPGVSTYGPTYVTPVGTGTAYTSAAVSCASVK